MERKNLMKRRRVNEIIQIDSDSCDENELTVNAEPHKKKSLNVSSTSESEETQTKDHMIDLCLHKAYCIYKSETCATISVEKFHLKLSKQIQKKYVKSTSCGDINSLRLIGRHFPSHYTSTGKNKLRRCVVCSKNDKRRESRYQCEECNVGLCIVPCFKIFHTEKYIQYI